MSLEDKLFPFKDLSLGARFLYFDGKDLGKTTWVKISYNEIAEWDDSRKTDYPFQAIAFFSENNDLEELVYVL